MMKVMYFFVSLVVLFASVLLLFVPFLSLSGSFFHLFADTFTFSSVAAALVVLNF